MSDTGRQNLTDKASNAMKPDSEKTLPEQAGDKLRGATDSVQSTLQPESEKSTTQKMGDSLSGNSNENSGSLLDSAKNALGMNSNK
ncbi:hypothetical protein BT96DRAFT_913105 [Gymnopus androsaceus JB14]|uniref:Heat shock protein 9/12 n=1 Tax=Gymnopus androsaceus JB14 TaxID=1447944 RepID=A0A6A4IBN2_9AGAR|nr:hypothetical protein BT96DRAFT_913105 [Gymnopus androsaceus JB14]